MRWLVVVALAGCYNAIPVEGAPCGEPNRSCPTGQRCGTDDRCHKDPTTSDIDAPPGGGDGGPDAMTIACAPRRLLTGGQDPVAQGWTIERSGSFSMTVGNGVTTMGTTNGGTQLLVLANALPTEKWGIQVIMTVTQSGGHTTNQAALALMASYRAPMGDAEDRKKMLWLETADAGWGDGTGSVGINMQQQATVKLERTNANGIKAAIQSMLGMASTTAGGFTTNRTIAIGDQSAAMGLDSQFQITSIDLYCP